MTLIRLVYLVTLVTGMLAGRWACALPPLFSENFDGLSLGPPLDEDWPFLNAFTHTTPTGWNMSLGQTPSGVREWDGWSFANKGFWVDVSRGEGREQFTLGSGTVAVADSDEWNDIGNPANALHFYQTLLKTPVIDISSAKKMPLKLQFDSSWRGGCCDDGERFDPNGNNQTAVLTAYTDVGPPIELLHWESAPFRDPVSGRPSINPAHTPNQYYKPDALNQHMLVDLRPPQPGEPPRPFLPEEAEQVAFEFRVSNAGDDGWWAVDNTSVVPLTTILGDMNVNDVRDIEDFAAFALGLRSTAAYRAQFFGEFPVTRGSTDSTFDFDDIPWFLDIMDQSGVLPSAAGAALLRSQLGVPEPSAMLLFAFGMANLWAVRWCARRRDVGAASRAARRPPRVGGPTSRGFSLVEVLVVVAIVAVLLGLLLPALQAAREASRRSACANNLRQLALATLNYESQHRVLPAGALIYTQEAQPGVSWRALILPFIEEATLLAKIDVQTDGWAAHREAARYISPVFQCPSAPAELHPSDFPYSHYEAVSGAGANPNEIRVLEDQFCGDIYLDGIYYPGSHTRIKHITDGTSQTFALGERKYDPYNWLDGVIWRGGQDVEMCAYATKNVRYPINADPAKFGYSVSDRDAPPTATRTMVRNDLFFGSAHTGGAFFALADGSVNFVSDTIDFLVYKSMASKAGNEASGLP
jgi:prepilin-type N-terminal cleavage/methylation domain-containing protein